MITLSQRIKKQKEQSSTNNRISIRDKLLTREVQELAQLLPSHCTVTYENVNDLSSFVLTIQPKKGFWQGGVFKFAIDVTEEYNMVVRWYQQCWIYVKAKKAWGKGHVILSTTEAPVGLALL